jgi:glutaredoxin
MASLSVAVNPMSSSRFERTLIRIGFGALVFIVAGSIVYKSTRAVQATPAQLVATNAVSVTVYGASWCPSCRQTRTWLDEKSIPYVEKDIDESMVARQTLRQLNPSGTIPVIDVDGQVVLGYSPQAIERAIRAAAARKGAR